MIQREDEQKKIHIEAETDYLPLTSWADLVILAVALHLFQNGDGNKEMERK
jgi:hypothetical protein